MAKRLRRKKIGTKHFGPIIEVTDPCYNKDVWCRMNDVKIVEGEYACIIWRHTEKYTYEGREVTDTRVGRIGIYLDGIIPQQKAMEQIGEIGVDAGLAGFFMDKPDYTGDEWPAFCNSIGWENDAWIKPEGFFSRSGYGDGGYPVVAGKNKDGEITSLEIIFI